MVNKYGKGKRYEKLARDVLIGEGYLVEKKNVSRWESDDFWGLFDILAISPLEGKTRLIQVKTHRSDFYKARKEIAEWCEDYKIEGISCEVWLKEPRKEWRIWIVGEETA